MNELYHGDNLDILRKYVETESVDLIYLDPPFNSKADYNMLFKSASGEASESQATAFKDTWEWDKEAAEAFGELMTSHAIPIPLKNLMESLKVFLTGDTGKRGNSMMAYLTMMALRLVELRRVLKPTGSLYLHCDPTASHYIKLVLDAVFGWGSFMNEITWQRTGARTSDKKFGRIHDCLLFYRPCKGFTWQAPRVDQSESYIASHFRKRDPEGRRFQDISLTGPGTSKGSSGEPWRGYDPTALGRHWALPQAVLESAGIEGISRQERLDALDNAGLIYWPSGSGFPRLTWYADALQGKEIGDIWTDIAAINSQASERLGYPTQKPEALLERIILASSNEGDLVLDPFCGCGTTIAVAEKLKRRWIGIDVTYLAVDLMERRLLDQFTPGKDTKRLADFPVQKRREALKAYFKDGSDILGVGLQTGLAPYEVKGVPEDLGAARFLAESDKFQFEWWCVAMVGAQGKERDTKDRAAMGADKGIDGIITFQDSEAEYKKSIVSVKGGKSVGSAFVDGLLGVVTNSGAVSGILITLEEPTGPMKQAAASAGRWHSSLHPTRSFPVLQIITVAELLKGVVPELPQWGLATFRRATQTKRATTQQEIAYAEPE
ncbi:MAG: restriction endonuclease [Armatimonadetes bacterium]|nr:restriction endonuclease [Armatimonadota bacterium]